MLCEKCGKNTATVYIRHTVNGAVSEKRLCQGCVKSDFGETPEAMLINSSYFLPNVFLNSPEQNAPTNRCPLCGSSFADLQEAGKVGCGECYSTFASELLPSVTRIHGNVRHAGKIPSHLSGAAALRLKTEKLQAELKECVASENYEEAAKIRDQIKELSKEGERL